MIRLLVRTTLALVVFAFMGPPSQAQFYGGWGGWGGWGGYGGGETVQGSVARGMGLFAAGAGAYNLDTAQATSINVDSAMRLNEYLYQSQMVSTRKYHQELAARRSRINTSADATYRRLRDNPTAADINSGDALNVILEQLNSPQVYLRSAREASKPIPSSLVKGIPFNYAIKAVTISLDELSRRGVPDVLTQNPAFESERQAVRDAFTQVKHEADGAGEVSPETLQKARAAVQALKAKVDATLAPGSPGRAASDNFLKALYGLARMLETPDVVQFLKELDTVDTTSVGALLGFMNSFNLRFGIAQTGAQRTAYGQLYPMLVVLRDQVAPTKPESGSPAVEPPDPKDATEFFSKIPYSDLQAAQKPLNGAAPAPPAPAPAPGR